MSIQRGHPAVWQTIQGAKLIYGADVDAAAVNAAAATNRIHRKPRLRRAAGRLSTPGRRKKPAHSHIHALRRLGGR